MLRDGDIDETTAEYLVTNDIKTSRYHTLPKTHRAQDEIGHLIIRPVISGNGSPIERLSEIVDYFINPEMQKLDSFIKNTRVLDSYTPSVNASPRTTPFIKYATKTLSKFHTVACRTPKPSSREKTKGK